MTTTGGTAIVSKSTVPTPVAAALGIVPTVVARARRVPGKVVQLPILAVASALTTLETVRREYDALADRGEQLVARVRGTSLDELEDRVEDRLAGTPLAAPYDRVEDAIEDATESLVGTVSDLLDRASAKRPTKASTKTSTKTSTKDTAKGVTTPTAPTGTLTRRDTAATDEVVAQVEEVASGATAPAHDALPLPDYDHLTLGSLRGRLRSLSLDDLVTVRAYEKEHADRLPVVTLLDHRIAKLATEAATPSPGGDLPVTPAPAAAGKVTKSQAKAKTDTTRASTKGAAQKSPRAKVRTT